VREFICVVFRFFFFFFFFRIKSSSCINGGKVQKEEKMVNYNMQMVSFVSQTLLKTRVG